MVDDRDALAAARTYLRGVATPHLVEFSREHRRRALPGRSAKAADVVVARCPGGIWLDVAGRAGVLFSLEEWAAFVASSLVALLEELPAPDGDTA